MKSSLFSIVRELIKGCTASVFPMAHQITSSPSRHTIYHDIDVSVDMIKEMEQNQRGEEQGTQESASLIEGEAPPTPPLVILLQVTTPRGEPAHC